MKKLEDVSNLHDSRLGAQRASASLSALAATIGLLTFSRLAMPDDIGALAMGTMQDLDDHEVTQWH